MNKKDASMPLSKDSKTKDALKSFKLGNESSANDLNNLDIDISVENQNGAQQNLKRDMSMPQSRNTATKSGIKSLKLLDNDTYSKSNNVESVKNDNLGSH